MFNTAVRPKVHPPPAIPERALGKSLGNLARADSVEGVLIALFRQETRIPSRRPQRRQERTVRGENKDTLRAGKTNKHAFPSGANPHAHTHRTRRRPRQTPWAHNDEATAGTAQAQSKRKMGDAHKHDGCATQEARATAAQRQQ